MSIFLPVSNGLVDQRKHFFLLALLLVVAFSAGIKNLRLDSNYKSFFAANNPQLIAQNDIQSTYGNADNLLFIIKPRNGTIYTPQTLATIGEITQQGWTVPYSQRVDSIANFQQVTADGDTLEVRSLFEKTELLTPEQLARVQASVIREPALVDRLVNEKGSVTAVNIMLTMPENLDVAVREINASARKIADAAMKNNPDVDVLLQGTAAVNQAFIDSSEKDGQTLMPLMFVTILAFLCYALRSLRATAITLLVIVMSTSVALGFCGWTGIALNQVNVIAPTVIMTLAVSDCVHVFVTYFEKNAHDEAPAAAMKSALREILRPLFLTSFTTVLGFLCINFSESPPLIEMGVITAVGVTAAFFITLFAVPYAAIRWLPQHKRISSESGRLVAKLSLLVTTYPRSVVTFFVAITLVFGALAVRNEFDDNYIKYFGSDTSIRRGADLVQSELTGIDTLAYSLDTRRANGIYDAKYLSAVASFVGWLEQQPEVVHVDSIIPLLKSLNRSMHGDAPEWYRVPLASDLVSQYLLLYEMSLGFGQDISNQIKTDKSASLVNLRLRVDKAKEIIDLDLRAQAWLAQNAPELTTHGASISLMFAYLGKNNIENMMIGNYWIIGMMVVTLIIGFSSFRFGMLSMLPNLSPAVIALGIWYLLDGEINIAVAVVFSVTLGIVVDDTIHFVNRYLDITRSGIASGVDAVRLTLNSVGNALVITSVVLASGFAVLGLSDFNVNAALGQMVSITIVMALLFDLAFLPALLVLLQRGHQHAVKIP